MPPQQQSSQASIDAFMSIETYLNPAVLEPSRLERLRAALEAGSLVVVRDAFQPEFAERVHAALDGCTSWKGYEGFEDYFHYHHHNLYDLADYPAALTWCRRVFESDSSREFAERISGRRCPDEISFSASWYLPGDHSLPHTDAGQNRQVAFIWHLSKQWRPEWGGSLYWGPKSTYLPPAFNSLVLFNVGPDTAHFVTTVSPYAQGKRLTVNGWWTGPDPTGKAVDRATARIDELIEIY